MDDMDVIIKKFQYINMHNGFYIANPEQLISHRNPQIQQYLWDFHCGPNHDHDQKGLLSIVNIKTKNSQQLKASHRCVDGILNLSTKMSPQRAPKCPNFAHHPYKLNQLLIKNIPQTYDTYTVQDLFRDYKSMITDIQLRQNGTNKTASVMLHSPNDGQAIITAFNGLKVYESNERSRCLRLSIHYKRVEPCGFTYLTSNSFVDFVNEYAKRSGVNLTRIQSWETYVLPRKAFDGYIPMTAQNVFQQPNPSKRRPTKRQTLKNCSPLDTTSSASSSCPPPRKKAKLNSNTNHFAVKDGKAIPSMHTGHNHQLKGASETSASSSCPPPRKKAKLNSNTNHFAVKDGKAIPSMHTGHNHQLKGASETPCNSNKSNNKNSLLLIDVESIPTPKFGNIKTSKLFTVPFQSLLMNAHTNRQVLGTQYKPTLQQICDDYGENMNTALSHIKRITHQTHHPIAHSKSVHIPNFSTFRQLKHRRLSKATRLNHCLNGVKEIAPKFVNEYLPPFTANEALSFVRGVTGKQSYPKVDDPTNAQCSQVDDVSVSPPLTAVNFIHPFPATPSKKKAISYDSCGEHSTRTKQHEREQISDHDKANSPLRRSLRLKAKQAKQSKSK
eukprot:937559_1